MQRNPRKQRAWVRAVLLAGTTTTGKYIKPSKYAPDDAQNDNEGDHNGDDNDGYWDVSGHGHDDLTVMEIDRVSQTIKAMIKCVRDLKHPHITRRSKLP
jgi:hypothetical protein